MPFNTPYLAGGGDCLRQSVQVHPRSDHIDRPTVDAIPQSVRLQRRRRSARAAASNLLQRQERRECRVDVQFHRQVKPRATLSRPDIHPHLAGDRRVLSAKFQKMDHCPLHDGHAHAAPRDRHPTLQQPRDSAQLQLRCRNLAFFLVLLNASPAIYRLMVGNIRQGTTLLD